MRPWILVAFSAPIAAASAVFLVYPIGQRFYAEGELLAKLSILCVHLRTDDWSDVIRTYLWKRSEASKAWVYHRIVGAEWK
jgi:hypothetical protein